MKVIVIGASRGIGLEFVRQYRAEGDSVTATAREAAGLARLEALGARALPLDLLDAASVAGLAWPLDGAAFDTVVLNAGVYGPDIDAMQTPEVTDFDAVMHTNVLGAMRVLPHVADLLAPGATLAVVSSRMGSIGERSSAAGWLYRASKAALNSVLKDVSITLEGKAVCVAFSPGWVQTDMGGAGADLTPAQSVSNMHGVIQGLRPADNGRFLNHDGSAIDW
jgi:NAD(P)-dependent dehydrogenase (short-subunit alcohol dehydrogenase family)